MGGERQAASASATAAVPTRAATTTTTGMSAATAPLTLMRAVRSAASTHTVTSSGVRLVAAAADDLLTAHAVTPVESSASLTTNSAGDEHHGRVAEAGQRLTEIENAGDPEARRDTDRDDLDRHAVRDERHDGQRQNGERHRHTGLIRRTWSRQPDGCSLSDRGRQALRSDRLVRSDSMTALIDVRDAGPVAAPSAAARSRVVVDRRRRRPASTPSACRVGSSGRRPCRARSRSRRASPARGFRATVGSASPFPSADGADAGGRRASATRDARRRPTVRDAAGRVRHRASPYDANLAIAASRAPSRSTAADAAAAIVEGVLLARYRFSLRSAESGAVPRRIAHARSHRTATQSAVAEGARRGALARSRGHARARPRQPAPPAMLTAIGHGRPRRRARSRRRARGRGVRRGRRSSRWAAAACSASTRAASSRRG